MPRTTFAIVPLLLCWYPCAVGCGDQVSYAPGTESDDANQPDGAGTSDAPGGPTLVTVSPQKALELLQDPPEGLVVLDVRTTGEFEAGHLEGAIQLDFYADDFETRVGALDRNVPYLLYCQSGGRSASTLNTMRGLGFRQVYEIDGGYGAWTAAGLPVAQD
jgi:rhodanese-related sulfurtransferase